MRLWYGARRRLQRARARSAGRGTISTKTWGRSRGARTLFWLAVLGDLVLLGWIMTDIWAAQTGWPVLPGWLQEVRIVFAAARPLILPLLIAGASYTVFVAWRHARITAWYRNRVTACPERRVPTAGSITGQVVGRDELCEVLMENLRASRTTFPNILVGGVGSGKTAVLVRLAQMLAEQRAVPVAVELREAQDKERFNFGDLGFAAFKRELGPRLTSESDAQKAWRQLLTDKRAVVLADGLEEALLDPTKVEDRENQIQIAIRDAVDIGLPLVIASRHHDPLRAIDAPIIELEPVGEGPALDYLTTESGAAERRRFASLVQAADVADAPLYLQLIRQLARRGGPGEGAAEQDWLTRMTAGFHSAPGEGRTVDRVALRLSLLDGWRSSVITGYLAEDYALPPARRRRTLAVLAALACVGLGDDSLEVDFADLTTGLADGSVADPRNIASGIANILQSRLSIMDLRPREDHCADTLPATSGAAAQRGLYSECVLAATMGSELGIVHQKGDRVRFRHSIIQAFLGTDYFEGALSDGAFLDRAFEKCGREFLLALVFYSRRSAAWLPVSDRSVPEPSATGPAPYGAADRVGRDPARTDQPAPGRPDMPDWMRRLRDTATSLRPYDRVASLRAFAAVADIEALMRLDAIDRPIVAELAEYWCCYEQHDIQERALMEAKAELVRRIGETAQLRAGQLPAGQLRPGQLRGGQPPAGQLGGGQLRGGQVVRDEDTDGWLDYRDLFRIAVREEDYAVRIAVTQQIALGRDRAFRALEGSAFQDWWTWWNEHWAALPAPAAGSDSGAAAVSSAVARTWNAEGWRAAAEEEGKWKEGLVCAWLAPLLFFHSTPEPAVADAPVDGQVYLDRELVNLKRWITEYLARIDPTHPEKRPWISLETALAQGFRYAANWRPRHTAEDARRRAAMIEQAEAALQHSRFWYAQLTLIQALTLLSLPDDPGGPLKQRGHGSDPQELVNYWCKIAGIGFADVEHRAGHHNHPFVRAAADLCRDALVTGKPAQYCWIDEAGTIGKVGSLQRPGRLHEHRQWILPSAGWSALSGSAQQLLGDVMLMLNLAERGDSPSLREERLSRADRPDLPPCLTRDSSALDVLRTVGSSKVSDPGSNCHDDCLFRLCPYPPVGERSYRAELTEGFCRQLGNQTTRLDYEKHVRKADHRAFWLRMSRRARPRTQSGCDQPPQARPWPWRMGSNRR